MASPSEPPRITFFFSDTGGGHRAASEAIIEAIHCEFGDSIQTSMVDFLKDYAPPPFNRLPEAYPEMVKVPGLYEAMLGVSDGRAQARLLTTTLWPYVGKAARKLVQENNCGLIVSVHPLATAFTARAMKKKSSPFVTVVTDLVTTHTLWFNPKSDLTIVPTEMARAHAIKCSVLPGKIRVVGQPVPADCAIPPGDKNAFRQQYGFPQEKFLALVIAGADGMGPLAETAAAIDDSDLDLAMVLVAGRNSTLEADLRQRTWRKPVYIYGYTREMPGLMRAADVIVTKAGPGTIAESLVAGLPMILFTHVPRQEEGNIDYVLSEKVGAWAPEPADVLGTLARWCSDPAGLALVRQSCLKAARPDASRQIARILGGFVGLANSDMPPGTDHNVASA